MLACARLGAVHSVVFGGFAPHELAIRIDDARPTVVLSASCGIEGQKVIPYKPLLDHALELATHAPEHCVILARDQAPRAAHARPATTTGRRSRPAASRSRPCRSRPPTRSTSSTRAARPAGRRASCATTAGTRWRCAGRWTRSTTPRPARSSGPRPTSAGSSATPTSSTRRCSQGATTVLYEGKPVGTPDPGAFWRVVAEHRVTTLFTAPTALRAIRKEDPEAEHLAASRRLVAARAVPRRRAPGPRHLPLGQAHPRRAPGRRPLVADGDRLADRRELPGHRGAAREAGLADAAGPGLRRARARRRRRGRRRGRHRRDRDPAAAAARHARDAVAGRRALRLLVPHDATPGTTSPATAARSTRTATSTSWGASTTSSTSPATGSRRGRWRRSSRRTPTSPSAP